MAHRGRLWRERRAARLFPILLAVFSLAIAFAASGCGTDSTSDGTGSPPDWLTLPTGGQHAKSSTRDYLADSANFRCGECHGADLSGGTSQVSCLDNPAGCHHGPVSGWVATAPAVQNHGAFAKQPTGSSGFVSCQICHGTDFAGGDSAVSCYTNTCHGVDAPHPEAPWQGSTYTHVDTDPGSAPVCKQCHFPGSPNNPADHPVTPAAAGTAPGCYNNTLCHGLGAPPHALGAAWRDPNPEFHGSSAKQDLTFCQGCHGTPGTTRFDGGSAATSCQDATCHASAKAHPVPWSQAPRPFPAYAASHRDSGNRDAACAICHLTDGPGAGPDPAAPSCYSASFNGVSCHAAGPGEAGHDVPFLGSEHTLADAARFNAECSACHAVTGVSPSSVAPLCTICHQSASALPFSNCTSCHGRPPSGTAYPDVAGAHAVHDALPNVAGTCDACHDGLDFGTAAHYERANARPGKNALRVPPGDVAFPAAYNAKPRAASFDNKALRCANVICHGGQTTPSWQTEAANAIDVPNACLSCHDDGTAQYNSYFSGQHKKHIEKFGLSAATCKRCHDVDRVNVDGHFDNLATQAFEQPAAATILSSVGYDGTRCSPGSLTGCHGNEKW